MVESGSRRGPLLQISEKQYRALCEPLVDRFADRLVNEFASLIADARQGKTMVRRLLAETRVLEFRQDETAADYVGLCLRHGIDLARLRAREATSKVLFSRHFGERTKLFLIERILERGFD